MALTHFSYAVNQYAQAMSTACNGSLAHSVQAGRLGVNSGWSAIWTLAGNTATSRATSPQAARRANRVKIATPSTISHSPLK